MLIWLIAALPTAYATDPVRVRVTDPGVSRVILKCGDTTLEQPVRDGLATFSQNPGKCEVHFVSRVGVLEGPGEFNCSLRGCAQKDVIHRTIEAAEGRVTIVITDESTTLLELKCPSGYRQRARVDTNTAVFDNVPEEDCSMFWKGGTNPAKANQIRPGTWYCQVTGGTGVCRRR